MNWVVYMLRCRDGSFYTGCTNNLERRLALHQRGRGAKYTRSRLPVELAWREDADGKPEALRREAAIKRLSHTRKESMANGFGNRMKSENNGKERSCHGGDFL